MFLSKKKEMRALWSLAPFPLFTGNPAPVILLPNSKSIKSYFFASSQWGRELSFRLGKSPPLKTSILSSSDFPIGTNLFGIFGIL